MSLPESVSNAACVVPGDMPTARARRVFLALAENLPESAVEKALDAWYPEEDWRAIFGETHSQRLDMRAAIIAALMGIAGETP